MKQGCILYLFCFLFISCHQQDMLEQQITHSIHKLSEIIKNKTSDTLILKAALDTAYQLGLYKSTRKHDSLFAAVSRLYGNEFYSIDNQKAKEIYRKGISIGLRQLPPSDNVIFRLYNNTAQLYYIALDYKMALTYFDSVKINSQAVDAQAVKLNFLLMIAECYTRLYDFKSAEHIFSEVEPIAHKLYPKEELGSYYTQYAVCQRLQKKYHTAIEKAESGQLLFQNLYKEKKITAENSTLWANNLYELAYNFHKITDFDKSENYYLQAMDIYKNRNDLFSYRYILRDMGNMYYISKRFGKAYQILTKGLNTFKTTDTDDASTRIKAGIYANRSEVYLAMKQYQKAIIDHDSAIHLFKLYEQKPSLTSVMMEARPVLLSVLTDKAKAHIALAEKGEDTEGYAKALKLMEEITELTDDIRADYISDEAKLTLSENVKPAFEKAIELCHTLFEKTKDTTYLHRAFAYAEQSRSMILYENARLETQLPDNLKAEREQLKQMESALSQKNNTDALQEYLRVKRMFREKIKSYNKNYLASIDEIRAQLLKNGQTALIEYFVGDSSIFVFTLTDKNCNLQKLPQTTDFDKQVATLREAVIKRNDTVFTKLSSQMYDEILRGGLASLSTNVNKLIIIPDGVLNYLPFEMLLSEKPTSFKNAPFLIKNYIISYGASANLLIEQSKKPLHNAAQETFVGFAPSYRNPKVKDDIYVLRTVTTRDSAYDLPGAIEEVQKIHEIVGGKTFMSADADVARFKKTAPRFKILHLAMHGLIDDNNPSNNRLLFTKNPADTLNNGELTAAELNTMTLHADLTVLSACNTGFGKLSKGEGVMSVARAFNYAGVPSTVMSLWVADDNETSGMMIDFYKNLKTGMPKDEALRQAKLNYLDRVKLDDKAAPFFWAAFVLSGNTEGVSFDRHLSVWMYAVMALALMASAFLFFKFKKNKMI